MARDPELLIPANVLPVGVFRTDLDGRCLYINDRVTALTGLSAEDARQFGWEHLIHADDREMVSLQIQSALHAGTAWQADFRCRLPDGSIRWILGQATPECDAHGHVVGFVGTLIDTTPSQATLRAGEERDAFLLRLSDALRPISDPLDVQETAARLLGEHLDVNRVGYAEMEDRGYVIRREYARGVTPLAGRGRSGAFGAALRDAFRRGDTVVVNDVRTDPRFTEMSGSACRRDRSRRWSGVMLLKGGRLVAAFGANNATPRHWTPAEIELDPRRRRTDLGRGRTRPRGGGAAGARTAAASGARCLGQAAHGPGTPAPIAWTGMTAFACDTASLPMNRRRSRRGCRACTRTTARRCSAFSTRSCRRRRKDAWDNTFRIVRPDGAVLWIQSLGRADRDVNGRGHAAHRTRTGRHRAPARRGSVPGAPRRGARSRTAAAAGDRHARHRVGGCAGPIVTANRALEAMFGWASGELIGQSIERLLPASLRDLHAQHRTEYFAAPRSASDGRRPGSRGSTAGTARRSRSK